MKPAWRLAIGWAALLAAVAIFVRARLTMARSVQQPSTETSANFDIADIEPITRGIVQRVESGLTEDSVRRRSRRPTRWRWARTPR